jgi:hypothetical protein
LGAIVELSIQLPVKQTGEASCRLEMQGEVFRVETPTGHESRWGFAVNAIKTVMHRPEACPVLSAQE